MCNRVLHTSTYGGPGPNSLKGGAVDLGTAGPIARSAVRKNLRPKVLEEVAVAIILDYTLVFWIRLRLTAVSRTLRVRFAAFIFIHK